jgi:thiamine biosynthesis lipoprotein
MQQRIRSHFVHRLVRVTRHASRVSILLLSACTPAPHIEQREFVAMGTAVSITAIGANANQALLADVEREFQRMGHEWYPWNKDSELAALNAALASGTPQTVSLALADVLHRADKIFRASEGAFDPAIAPMVESWGFNGSELTVAAPDATLLQTWRVSRATFADLRLEQRIATSVRRDIMLDLGAIGKGYAVDRAIERLRQSGVQNALVNAGGNLRAIGRHPDRAWRIAIRHPRSDGVFATIQLDNDASVATSGDYERFAVITGQRAHHILDPRTGQPALHTTSLTVFADDATLADAASTALFVAGPDHWLAMARTLRVAGVVRIDADGRVQATRNLQPRLHVSDLTVNLHWVDL